MAPLAVPPRNDIGFDGPPRHRGLAVAAVTLLGFWPAAAAMLLVRDPDGGSRRLWRELKAVLMRERMAGAFARALRDHARVGFHPWQRDDLALARSYLEAPGVASSLLSVRGGA